jgi:uncharacterized metal-binding protein YceD (DUF177 family)
MMKKKIPMCITSQGGESHLNVEAWIYEFILLSIPTHPMCNEDEIGGPKCNKQVLEMLKKMI